MPLNRWQRGAFAFTALGLVLVPRPSVADAPLLCLERVAFEVAPDPPTEELPPWHVWLERRAARSGAEVAWLTATRPGVPSRPRERDAALSWALQGIELLRANRYWGDGALLDSERRAFVVEIEAVLRGLSTRGAADDVELNLAQQGFLDLALAVDGLNTELCGRLLEVGDGGVPVATHQSLLKADCFSAIEGMELRRISMLKAAASGAPPGGSDQIYSLMALAEAYVGVSETNEAIETLKEVVTVVDQRFENPVDGDTLASRGEMRWFKQQALIRLARLLEATCAEDQMTGCDEFRAGQPRDPVRWALSLLRGSRLQDPTRRVEILQSKTLPEAADALETLRAEDWHEPLLSALKAERAENPMSSEVPLLEAAIACLHAAAGDDHGFLASTQRFELLMSPDSSWMTANSENSEAWYRLGVSVDLLEATGRAVGFLERARAEGDPSRER